MPLRVKFINKSPSADPSNYWKRFLPEGNTRIGDVEFLFHPQERSYDWLVVYDDLPSSKGERFSKWTEILDCDRRNTLLITAEPATIKIYGRSFLAQFGHVLTSQEPWAVPHSGAIFSQCGLVWFYGKTYSEAVAEFPANKDQSISTVCSSKQQRNTLHSLRHSFTARLKKQLPELEVYGHGHRPIASKVETLDPYRYHIAIENHYAPHHWTEKLADAFLGGCLPFYFGCPNVFDYFPEESLIPIDITDFEQSLEVVREAIAHKAYEKRLPAIKEARRRVLEEYSTFPMLAKLLPKLHVESSSSGEQILSRHEWRHKHPLGALSYGIERVLNQRRATRDMRNRFVRKARL
ncbi:MAG: glycosyltransferase [Opitutales bacterium]|nr:glycosyltransferase [Opitutales bacterium]